MVAERLSGQADIVSSANRSQNEESLWAVNAELGTWHPTMEDEQMAMDGRLSRENNWFQLKSEQETEAVLEVVEKAEV